uniref:Solute carrier family 22 member 4 n=1 Tax=Maylandia zebra TaxID=106582 RepID=A0A3P9D3S0_9CICH
MQDYEASISFLGTWGRFQMKVFFLLCVTCLPAGYNILSVIFLLATPPHQCYIPAHRNLSQDWMQASIPLQVAGQLERSSCSRYELDLVQNLSELGIRPNLGVMLSSLKQEECKDGWIYSTEHYESTVVTEVLLLTSWLNYIVACEFGRKPVLFGAIATLSIFSLALKFAQSWAVFAVLFFMVGMGQLTSYIVLFVLGSEILAGSSRVLYASMCLPFMYVFGMMLLPATAYLLRNWKHLSLLMALPGLASLPLWWLIPESPRWLVSKGRLQEAERLLRSAALENGVEAPPVIFLSANVRTLNFLDLLKAKSIRSVTLILWFLWLSTHVTYSGLSFNMSTLYGNPFLNYFLLSAVELPAYTVSWLSACRLSRRLSFISFSLLGALALFLIQLTLFPLPPGHPALTLFLVLLGKFGVLVGTGILYMFTGELSPTVIRNTVMSSCAMLSRVGSSISPYLLQLAVFYEFLPWMLVGSLSLVSVVLCFFLPETFREPLPDTIDQMQPLGMHSPATLLGTPVQLCVNANI